MKKYKVAVLGATGAVGQEMIKILQERQFPVSELVPLASARSVGKLIDFNGEKVAIKEAKEDAFEGIDIVLGAAENDIAEKYADAIVKSGAVFVDNSSAFRLDPNVPLVVPEVNGEDVKNHKGIIANPNCVTTIALTAVNAIHQIAPIKSIIASSYQAVSGAGAAGPVELEGQMKALANGEQPEVKVFQYQIAYNLIPQIGGEQESGYTRADEVNEKAYAEELISSFGCGVVSQHAVRRPQDSARSRYEGQLHLCSRSRYPQPLCLSDPALRPSCFRRRSTCGSGKCSRCQAG